MIPPCRPRSTSYPPRLRAIYPTEEGIGATYQAYKRKLYDVARTKEVDSLDQLFLNAQGADEATILALKEASKQCYLEGQAAVQQWVDTLLTEEPHSLFGLYLYYTHRFGNKDLYQLAEIEQERAHLNSYEEEVLHSSYAQWISERLDAKAKSAIGQVAPDIIGTTPEGETKRLSDYRGSYILLDFWSSTCTWCRLEVPTLKQALSEYGPKGLRILGASSDRDHETWLQAIREDEATWEHILLSPEEKQATFNAYTITGIPHILLIAPDGTILAKGLRGEALLDSLSTHLPE